MNWGALAAAGVDLEATLSARRWGRRAARQARRDAPPALDVDAWLRDWTTPARNRPPGLDGAAAFLHAFQDEVDAGARHAAPAPSLPPEPCQTCEGIDPPAKVGDGCEQGGTVSGVGRRVFFENMMGLTDMCVSSVTCRGDNKCDCYEDPSHPACIGDGGYGTVHSCGGEATGVTSVRCNYVEVLGEGQCLCDVTCSLADGTSKTATWYDSPMGACTDADPNMEESTIRFATPRPCDQPDDWGDPPGDDPTDPPRDDPSPDLPGVGAGKPGGTAPGVPVDPKDGTWKAGCVKNQSLQPVYAVACNKGAPGYYAESWVQPGHDNCDGTDWDFVLNPLINQWYKVTGASILFGGVVVTTFRCDLCECRVPQPCMDCP